MGGFRGPRSRPPVRKPAPFDAARDRGRLTTQRRYVQPPMADPSRNLPPHPVRDLGVPDPDKITGSRSFLEDRAHRPLVPSKADNPRPKGLWKRLKSWFREPVRSPYRPGPAPKVRGWPQHQPVTGPIGGPSPGRIGTSPPAAVPVGGRGAGAGPGPLGAHIAVEIIKGGIERGIQRREARQRWERVADHGFRNLFSGAQTIGPWRPGRKTPPSWVTAGGLPHAGAGSRPPAGRARPGHLAGPMPWDLPKSWLPDKRTQQSVFRPTTAPQPRTTGWPDRMPWDLPQSWLPGKGPQQSIHGPAASSVRSRPTPPAQMPWDLPKSWLPRAGPQQSFLRHTGAAGSADDRGSLSGAMPWDLPRSWLPGQGTRQSVFPRSVVQPPQCRSRPYANQSHPLKGAPYL